MKIKLNIGPHSEVYITGEVMAMFSQQPVLFTIDPQEAQAEECRVTIVNRDTGERISEARNTISKGDNVEADFEVSRMLQLVCDTDGILERVKYDGSLCRLSDVVDITFGIKAGGQWRDLVTQTCEAIHGSCDWGEEISPYKRITRRLWVNFPYTLSADKGDEVMVQGEGSYYFNDDAHLNQVNYEINPAPELDDGMNDGVYYDRGLLAGYTRDMWVSAMYGISMGEGEIRATLKRYTFIPQLDAMGKGVYLRWLHRDGTVGYWLFTKSKNTHKVAQVQSFAKSLIGNTAKPVDRTYPSSARQSFSHEEALTIGTANVTEEEYAFLLGLAESPVVEMLVYQGEAGEKYAPLWARVTVAPATYNIDIPKTELPRLRDFELTIALPERNTARL